MSLFINLRHPRDFTSHTSRRGTLYIYSYYCRPIHQLPTPIFEKSWFRSRKNAHFSLLIYTRYQIPGTTYCSFLQQYYLFLLIFIYFSIPFIFFDLLSLSLLVVTPDPGSHSRLFSPLPTAVRELHFYREKKVFLPSSTRVELYPPTLQ